MKKCSGAIYPTFPVIARSEATKQSICSGRHWSASSGRVYSGCSDHTNLSFLRKQESNIKKSIHFVGIGGVGMSAIANILLDKGEIVTGSDIRDTHIIQKLRDKGAVIYIGHRAENVRNARLLVVSSAIHKTNIELKEAKKRKIPIVSRAVMLASLMKDSKNIIIAGMHGKTTTTSMVSFLLESNGFDPTLAIGGELKVFGGNAKLGRGEYFVAEADESDGSFLKLSPDIAIVTNIEPEHLDYYKNTQQIKNAFTNFLSNIRPGGAAVLCLDDKNISDIVLHELSVIARSEATKQSICSGRHWSASSGRHWSASSGRVYSANKSSKLDHYSNGSVDSAGAEFCPMQCITYGIKNKKANILAKNIQLKPLGSKFSVVKDGVLLGTVQLNVPGIHNVLNALAVIGTGLFLGIGFKEICNTLSKFRNVRRRFEVKGNVRGILIIDDYAHHPTEIRMTLQSAKRLNRKRMIVVFQPHRWTRTKFLGKEIGRALSSADIIFLMEVYSAGEKPIPGIHPKLILEGIKPFNKNVKFIKDPEDLISELLRTLKKGDLLITLGAGDVYKIGEETKERIHIK